MNLHVYKGYKNNAGNYGQFDMFSDPFASLTSAVTSALSEVQTIAAETIAPVVDIVSDPMLAAQQFLAPESPAAPSEQPYVVSQGWKRTRAAGILAVLLAAHPEMNLADVANFKIWNNISAWEEDVSPSDNTLMGAGGTTGNANYEMYFDPAYNWPANGQDLFVRWSNGEVISSLPLVDIVSEEIVPVVDVAQPVVTTDEGPGMLPLMLLYFIS